MFKAKTNVELLIECAEAIVGVVDEAVLSITRDGLEVNAVDPANVAMVGLKLSRSSFDNFEFESPEDPLKIGIDFANLLRVLKSWKRKPVELELREKTLFVRRGCQCPRFGRRTDCRRYSNKAWHYVSKAVWSFGVHANSHWCN